MLRNIIRLLRVYQWPKNVLLFAALIFAERLSHQPSVIAALIGFLSFCFIASASYIVNDIVDIESDRKHPQKKDRPLASGIFSKTQGWIIAFVLGVTGFLSGYVVSVEFLFVLVVYALLTNVYSYVFKHIELVDLIVVSLGFVLRAIAGGVAIGVTISTWLFVTTFFLSLFLIIGKRRHEILLLGGGAEAVRKSLKNYTPQFLDILITIVATASLLSFVLYTQAPDVIARLGTPNLVYTVPVVVFGLFRYLLLVYSKNGGGDPSSTLITDQHILAAGFLWGLGVVVIIYL